ncbi:hypothetical protein FJW06_03680 [Mesorhizobium sp. B4-1-3]|uniref:hypothetical protein n=1 Tax=Mesorhizobium sp. B4-1-3 TaxID=2589889 RepID=UPI00112C9A5B|nr:hypothetical protein [Mesorhizobium sp. B4-1-3]TPI16335.1 hypothetical protein FJW06_03680 [Mesorhizobium sp. B4-1-3]
MKILSLLKGFSGTEARPRDDGEIARWITDPLSHPVLDTMSERELADMPFRLTARRTVYEMMGAAGR